MMLRLLVWNAGVEVYSIDVVPLVRCCRPALGIVLTRRRIDPGTLLKQGAVQACMALGWRHKADGAVMVLAVVPVRQVRDPAACGQQIVKRAYWQFGAVFQGSKGRFDIGIVVTDGPAAAGVGRTQAPNGRQRGLAFHGRAVVRVHRQLARADALTLSDVPQQLAGQLRTFAIEHLTADDLATEQVLEQIKVKVLPAHLCWQTGDVPAEHLVGAGGDQRSRLAALLHCTF